MNKKEIEILLLESKYRSRETVLLMAVFVIFIMAQLTSGVLSSAYFGMAFVIFGIIVFWKGPKERKEIQVMVEKLK